MSASVSERRRAPAVLLVALAGCAAAPGAEEADLARLLWTPPQNVEARTILPEGLGTAGPVRMVMVLQDVPGTAPLAQSFTLVPAEGEARHRLASGDYRRFRQFQTHAMAGIGTAARVGVELMVPYCAVSGTAAGSGAPVVEVSDVASGVVLMSSPAEEDARALHPRLPACA